MRECACVCVKSGVSEGRDVELSLWCEADVRRFHNELNYVRWEEQTAITFKEQRIVQAGPSHSSCSAFISQFSSVLLVSRLLWHHILTKRV